MSGSTNQGFTHFSYNGVNNTTTDNNQWIRPAPYTQDIPQIGSTLEWSSPSAPPTPNNIPVPVTTNNGPCNPTNYMSIPYSNGGTPNGYITLNPTRPINEQLNNGSHSNTHRNKVISGHNWHHQSALGRFFSQPSSWNNRKAVAGVKRPKRIRTAFTSQQMMQLEQEYAKTRYMDRARRIELANILHLNDRTIKIWFQNRRMKEKKDKAESLEDSEGVGSTEVGNIEIPHIHENCPIYTNACYNQSCLNTEQFLVTVTSSIMVPSEQRPAQNLNWVSEEQCYQYLQTHNQIQKYPLHNCEAPQLSSNTDHNAEEVPAASSVDIIDQS